MGDVQWFVVNNSSARRANASVTQEVDRHENAIGKDIVHEFGSSVGSVD